MLTKRFAYWCYLNRRFTGIFNGRKHWLHGFGPIWATLLPWASLGDVLIHHLFDVEDRFPVHVVISGVIAIFFAILGNELAERHEWESEFDSIDSDQLRVHICATGIISVGSFFLYIWTVLFLWSDLRSIPVT